MRLPRDIAYFNRRVTNRAAQSITPPWLPGLGTLQHIGRESGRRYRTPLLVFPTRDGFVILIGYGLESDWLKNVLAGGATALEKRNKAVPLVDPRICSKADAANLVTPAFRTFYRLFPPYNEAALVLTRSANTSS